MIAKANQPILKVDFTKYNLAVQMCQEKMVVFLLGKGAGTNLCYPDGLSALEIARIVKSPKLEAAINGVGVIFR